MLLSMDDGYSKHVPIKLAPNIINPENISLSIRLHPLLTHSPGQRMRNPQREQVSNFPEIVQQKNISKTTDKIGIFIVHQTCDDSMRRKSASQPKTVFNPPPSSPASQANKRTATFRISSSFLLLLLVEPQPVNCGEWNAWLCTSHSCWAESLSH